MSFSRILFCLVLILGVAIASFAQPTPEYTADVTGLDNATYVFWTFESQGTVLYHREGLTYTFYAYPTEEELFGFTLPNDMASYRFMDAYTFDNDDNVEVFVAQQIGDNYPYLTHYYVEDCVTGEIQMEWNTEGSSYQYNKFYYTDTSTGLAYHRFGMTETAADGSKEFILYEIADALDELVPEYTLELDSTQMVLDLSIYDFDEDPNFELLIRDQVDLFFNYQYHYDVWDMTDETVQWALNEETIGYTVSDLNFWEPGYESYRPKIHVVEKDTADNMTVKVYDLGLENAVAESGVEMPATAHLAQNYPNPFNPSTSIRYSLERPGVAKLVVYDIEGREVTTLLNQHHSPGEYVAPWKPENLASGTYFYQLLLDGRPVGVRKAVLVK